MEEKNEKVLRVPLHASYNFWALRNGPGCTQEFVGSFLAEPFGPVEATFDVTGLLVNGENEIHFQGYPAPDHPDLDPGNYLIAQIDIDYFESEASIPIAEAGPDRVVFNGWRSRVGLIRQESIHKQRLIKWWLKPLRKLRQQMTRS